MQFRILILFLIILFGCQSIYTTSLTDEFSLIFQPTFGDKRLMINKKYAYQSDSVEINTLRFYLSNFKFYNKNKLVFKETNSYHLMDLSDVNSLKLQFKNSDNPAFNRIQFDIGIDSLTNVSGAFGGDLDPTKGMYWTWQSGYINFKLEGKSKFCDTRNNEFQFHLGGYEPPLYGLQTVYLTIGEQTKPIVNIDIQEFLSEIDLKYQNSIMSPSKKAVELSEKIGGSFGVGQTALPLLKN
jgi:hypothetical protein